MAVDDDRTESSDHIPKIDETVWGARTDPLLQDLRASDAAVVGDPTFSTAWRGYDQEEVNGFVHRALTRIRALERQLTPAGQAEAEQERAELRRQVADLQARADAAARSQGEVEELRGQVARAQELERQLTEARAEAARTADLERELTSTRAQLDRVLESKPDAYVSLANQVADLLSTRRPTGSCVKPEPRRSNSAERRPRRRRRSAGKRTPRPMRSAATPRPRPTA
jgi:cell division septum initiation protein DivIVA